MSDKLKVFVCHDHFERLIRDDVCDTCPSRVENKEVVEAMAKVYAAEPEQVNQAMFTEMQSIRRTQQTLAAELAIAKESSEKIIRLTVMMEAQTRDIARICRIVADGNGQPSLLTRMSTVETAAEGHASDIASLRSNASARELSNWQLALGAFGIVAASLLSAGSLIVSVLK